MPCNSEHLRPHWNEVAASRVFQLLDELDGTRDRPDKAAWEGTDPRAYGHMGNVNLDAITADLCSRLRQRGGTDGLSPEMQMWWRDHQEADAKREADEKMQEAWGNVVKRAEAKLTTEELLALHRAWLRSVGL